MRSSEFDGTYIIVLDAGFVYYGRCEFGRTYMTVTDAKNIRRWGTKKGLGELRDGPTKETIIDDAGTVIVPITRIVHLLRARWK